MRFFTYEENKIGRTGVITTAHGNILTPGFIFCATNGAIKGMPHDFLNAKEHIQILLCNTFHLDLYSKRIEKLGGLHKFMNWNGPIITDSGGFQIFSLGHGYVADEIKGIRRNRFKSLININEDGCFFKDPKSGDLRFLSPERSLEIQTKELKVDLSVSFDECTASHSGYEYTKSSTLRSHEWELRSLIEHKKHADNQQYIYGIVQGGIYEDLRDLSVNFVNKNDFDAIAIGGSLGQTKEDMYKVVKYTSEKLDKTRPIHLLGIGKVADIIELAPYVDTFDCVEPTRIARHGMALHPQKNLNLRNASYRTDENPIMSGCECYTCLNHSRAYIAYLLQIDEISAITYIVNHNMVFMNKLMSDVRYHMSNNTYNQLHNKYL
jgi:queuine tRNA-ribosyltransferase